MEPPRGVALLQYEFRDSFNHNRIVVTSDASAADILSAADEILGGAGRGYRNVSAVDDALGHELKPDFVAAGFEHEPLVTMIYSVPEPEPPAHQVQAVSFEIMRPAIIRDWRVEMLADRTTLYSLGAEIAARADFYFDRANSIAQLESLFTHPKFRGRGYGSSLVREAPRRSQEAGCKLSFLETDLGGGPQQWYTRLGYAEARRTHDFIRVVQRFHGRPMDGASGAQLTETALATLPGGAW